MHLQAQTLTNQFAPFVAPLKPTSKSRFASLNACRFRKISYRALTCSVSTICESAPTELRNVKPLPAEVSRTIMELSSVGTLSSLTQEGWPLGIGVRFAVDQDGTPLLSLNESLRELSIDRRSSLHVQLEQCGLRTPQCTIQGSLGKPDNKMILKLHTTWKKRFGEEINEDILYIVTVDRVLQIDDFGEVGVWVNSSDYKTASPDPLRNFAERLVDEINTNNAEDVHRFCNIYADLNFQFAEAKLIWVDRLGFDLRVFSPQKGTFEFRIPFPSEVTDEKGAKSMFNGMSQQAWEVERNFQALDFERVKQLKMIKPLHSVE
ncbi:glutamyl-tRNA reductase-binding protein, chloroplastic isoform X2 [Momordica charantia]|uniref:Glutamyl-tRNA reductase-binding protein, chloroplastic isoform X2 n=1 Tax=Momordica charantia TaxID=3673 RepID=A0A6J1CZY8_MOMCH|nr:glutamyl-tRNA reductase-binding protein, chloroplastic isoform X2 [Momordica charantia]